MRVIKFRAWREKSKSMSPPLTILDWISLGTYQGDFIESHEVRFMQFTGLKDKNGVEICEDDILDIGGGQKVIVNMNISKQIKYGHGDCGFSIGLNIASGYGDGSDIKVIGNIHQNPELLEG